MTARRRSLSRSFANGLLAFALALSALAPGHGFAVSEAVAAGPGGEGLIVICSPGGPRLIDPVTGEAADDPAGSAPLKAHLDPGCVLCCSMAANGLRPTPPLSAAPILWEPAFTAGFADTASRAPAAPFRSQAAPRAPPRARA